MVADARCWTCGGVKIPNGTTKGEKWCVCDGAPPPPWPPQADQPVKIGGTAPGTFIAILAVGLAVVAWLLTHPY